MQQFRALVASYIKRNNSAPSTFGRKVMSDPTWVAKLMAGLEPKERNRNKVLRAMQKPWGQS
jgi:hypothetical protein